MKKSLAREFASARNRVISNAEDLVQDVYKSSAVFIKDVSKSMAAINWAGMYKDARKSIRIASKRGNKAIAKSLKQFRKSDFYSTITGVPVYMTQVKRWTSVQIRRIRNYSVSTYFTGRKWLIKNYPKFQSWVGNTSTQAEKWIGIQYPKVKSFVKANYPRIENFILTGIPVYRAVFTRA